MKKQIGLCIFVSMLTLGACSAPSSSVGQDASKEEPGIYYSSSNDLDAVLHEEYRKNTENFIPIAPSEIQEMMKEKNPFFVYFGRETCPYCRNFVAELNKSQQTTNKTIYYLDTENSDGNRYIKEIRKELGVEYIPMLLLMKDEKIFKFDSERDSLQDFLLQ